MERPNIPIGQHPIEEGQYILPTMEVLRLVDALHKRIDNRSPGFIVYGSPRLGKTRAIGFAVKKLPQLLNSKIPIYKTKCNEYRLPTEEKFFLDMLHDFGFELPSRKKSVILRQQIIAMMHERAELSKLRRVVLIIDEAHRMTEWHYNWLMDIFNELDDRKISMTVISVGQEELKTRRTFFLENKKSQIIGRFMTQEHVFHGIQTEKELAYCLRCYDKFSEYPENSGWSFTRYFFPDAYQDGCRLENFSEDLYSTFVDLRREYGLSESFELPMEYVAHTVENALKVYGANGKNEEWLNINHWHQAIKLSGYIESEIYMALAK